jgi:hypothetical protein
MASLSEFFRTLGATDEQLAQIIEKLHTHTGISTKPKGSMGGVEQFADGEVPTSTDQLPSDPRAFVKLCRDVASNPDMGRFLGAHSAILILMWFSMFPDMIEQFANHTTRRDGLTLSQCLNCDEIIILIDAFPIVRELIREGKFVEAYAVIWGAVELFRMHTGNPKLIIATVAKQLANDITAMCAPASKPRASAGAGGAAARNPHKPSKHTLAAAAGIETPRASKPPAPKGAGKAASAPTRPTKPCAFFNTDRGCKNGDKCPFLHIRATPSLPETAPEPATRGQDCFGHSG